MAVTINGSSSVTINSGAVLGITSGTSVPSTSGTSIDFTSIPSWVKRITVMLLSVSTNGTTALRFRVGSSSVQTSGYAASGTAIGGTAVFSTAGFDTGGARGAGDSNSGTFTLVLQDAATNTWVGTGILAFTNGAGLILFGGSLSVSGVLTRVQLTTTNGTDTFDAGSINILYEG